MKSDKFKLEKGVPRTSKNHTERNTKILNTMLDAEVGHSFLVQETDIKQAKSVQAQVSYLRRLYKEFNKTYFTTMIVYEKGKLQGVRVFRDK